MLSLGNTYSLDELHEFIGRIEKELGQTEFVCELKFDGTAISLTYEHGALLRAVTRGDGTRGDDVTANIRTIRTIPLHLQGGDYPDFFEIRGEVLMPYASFDRLNAEREANGETVFEVRVADGDMGKVIGRQGRIVKEIRILMKAVAQRKGKKVSVEIMD